LLLLLAITKFNFNEPQNKQKLKKPYVIILILGFIIAGLDFYYFNILNKKTVVVNEEKIDTELNGKNEIACEFNNKKPFVKIYMDLITDIDIQFGNPKSDNVIIEIFDPNCTHCKKLHLEMKKIIEQYENDVFIVIKPNPLWNYSIQQIQALYIANEYGKFDEMLTEQFARLKPRKGMDLNQLIEIAEIIGLDSQILKQRIKKADFLNHIIQENQKVKKSGITSAPTLLLNGYTIASKSRTTECIGELLD
jgi:predicted DsbA family dithiol-disulfide isomerase